MGFVGDDGEYTGFDLDLAKEVADRLDMKFVPKPISWDAKDMELSSGGIDCIWNGFTMTGREDKYTWSEPYLNNEQVFVVKKDSGIKTQADLAGKVVDVQTDSSAQKALEQQEKLQKSFKELKIVADYNTAFMDLESGQLMRSRWILSSQNTRLNRESRLCTFGRCIGIRGICSRIFEGQ